MTSASLLSRVLLAAAVALFAFAFLAVRRAGASAGADSSAPAVPLAAAAAVAAALACTLAGALTGWAGALTPLYSLPAAAGEDAFHRLFAPRDSFAPAAAAPSS